MKSSLAGRLDEKAFNMRNCSETMLEGNMGYNMALKLGECYIHTCYMYISNQSVNVASNTSGVDARIAICSVNFSFISDFW